MAKPFRVPPPGFDELPVEDKIAYVQALWERITAHPHDVPVPDWHERVLDERLKEASDSEEEPWDVARENIRKELRGGRE